MFIVLFTASIVIFVFVLSYAKITDISKSSETDRRKGFSNRATVAMFTATVTNFLLSSLNTGIHITEFVVAIRGGLIVGVDNPLPELREVSSDALRKLDTVSLLGSIVCTVAIFLSDFIVIWRARAVFPARQWVILIPFILWIGAVGKYTFFWNLFPFADSIILPGLTIGGQISILLSWYLGADAWHLHFPLITAGITLSIATNTVMTMMIAYRLWYVAVGGAHGVQRLTLK